MRSISALQLYHLIAIAMKWYKSKTGKNKWGKNIMRLSTITKALLASLMVGCVVVAPGSVFALAALVKVLNEAQYKAIPVSIPEESDPRNVRRSLYRLKKNEYLKIKQIGKTKFKFELTKKGKKLFARHKFTDFTLASKERWDKQWRMFVFDIPEKKKLLREALRSKLKKLGFFLFQKSVWIYPFECEEEMRYVCEFLDIQPYTLMFTGKIHNDALLRKHFVYKRVLKKSDIF